MRFLNSMVKLSKVVASILVFALPVCAYAQEEKAINPDAHSYAETYRVPISEANDRLNKIKEFRELGARLEKENKGTFAGFYIEHQPVFRAVARFTSESKKNVARYTNDPMVVAENAPYSLDLLTSAKAELDQTLSKLDIRFESGLDIKRSEVNVYVLDPSAVAPRISKLLAKYPFVKLRKTTGFTVPDSISGGDIIRDASGRCTTGFNVVDSNRELGVTTAGHCGFTGGACQNGWYLSSDPSITLQCQQETYGGSYDLKWYKQLSTQTPQQVQKNEISLTGGPSATRQITGTTPSSGTVVGEIVCKSGVSGGYLCGEIKDKARSVLVNNVLGTLVQAHNVNNLALSVGGDSGGPVFIGNSAVGIVHGHPPVGAPDEKDMFYMPIELFSTFGISVLTKEFKVSGVADSSGPHYSDIPVNVDFEGTPKWPVELTVDVVQCPISSCTGGTLSYTVNKPSPLTYYWICYLDSSHPTVTTRLRTTLKDASGITSTPVEHNVTCTTGGASPRALPDGKPRAGISQRAD